MTAVPPPHARPPQQRVWVGNPDDPAKPRDALPPAEHACCGCCYPEHVECVDAALGALLAAAALVICTHRDTGLLCASCGLRVLGLADRVRNSSRFCMDERTTWELSLSALIDHELLTEDERSVLLLIYDGLDDVGYDDGRVETTLELLLMLKRPDETAVQRVVDAFYSRAAAAAPAVNQPLTPVQPRTSTSSPPRKAYQRGELAIAEREGWPKPQRHMLERRVRAAAVAAWSEADFVRGVVADGLAVFPRLSTADEFGVSGYSVADPAIPPDLRVLFGGGSLAADLTLPRLRRAWTSEPSSTDAWATWITLAEPNLLADGSLQPAVPSDGRWRWVHPSLPLLPVPKVTLQWPAGSRPPREVVREVLAARQAGRCALCSIRWHHWERTFGTPVPDGLLGSPDHVDHDHATGLVRGLLCRGCNTVREPREARYRGDVWRTYVADPPAASLGWHHYSLG